jgi:hydroxymethylbilane synthase
MESSLTIGTREDGLARAQADLFVEHLKEHAPSYPIHLELVRPEQDRRVSVHVDHIAENRHNIEVLHRILREGDCDVVIHRGFDLRDDLPADLSIVAIPQRSSPYDALLSPSGLTLDELEEGAVVGVVQLRARVQMLQYRRDLDWTLMTGDVATWLADLIDQKVQALVMPNAAIEQLGLQERVSEIFPADLVIPAPCSGILVCVTRKDDERTRSHLACIHHRPTAREYAAERSFMDALEREWDSPVAALAQCKGERLLLLGMVADADGYRLLREGVEGKSSESTEVGEAVAELLRHGLDGSTDDDMDCGEVFDELEENLDLEEEEFPEWPE